MALAIVPIWPSGAAEPKLTRGNSVVAALSLSDSVNINGLGCNVPASATLPLPAGASETRVQRPSVGARGQDGKVTNVSVQGSAVTVTAVGEGERICDPDSDTTPPANRPWSAGFDVEASFKQQVGVVLWDDDQDGGKAFMVRPREVRIRAGLAAQRVRWTRFGGSKAVGLGTFRSLTPCAGGRCTDNGTRLRVELTRPGHCSGLTLPGHKEDVIFYGKVAFVLRQRLGVLRPGTEWISTKLKCPATGRPPIPVR